MLLSSISGYAFFGQPKQKLTTTVDMMSVGSRDAQLRIVRRFLMKNDLNGAEQLLSYLNHRALNLAQRQRQTLYQAVFQLKRYHPRAALRFLSHVHHVKSLSVDLQIIYYSTAVQARLQNHDVAYSAIARMSLNQLLTDQNEQLQNRKIIWYQLQTQSRTTLNQLLRRSRSSLLQGWLKLAIIAKTQANDPHILVSAVNAWCVAYPNHSANLIIPDDRALLSANHINNPLQIALLLPLHGSFGQMGQAVRDGFMTAFYQWGKSLPRMPQVKVIDTSQDKDVRTLYQQAIKAGAQCVIGPLTKEKVSRLMGARISVPTVVLNYVNHFSPPKLIQLGLSPIQAVTQVADRAWQRNVHRFIVIAPTGRWGQRVQQTFSRDWRQQGGVIVDRVTVAAQDDLNQKIATLLHIDQSKQRVKNLSNTLNKKLKVVLRRRQDIDAIFIITNPLLTRQIYPLLRYYYAGNLPIFSISSIYKGYPDVSANQDLEGIQFNDMPWLFEKSDLRQQIQSLWPDNYRQNNRLYALGIDAYRLTTLFNRLKYMPNFAVQGVTGDLFLNSHQQVLRQLVWAKFEKGLANERSHE